MLYVFFHENVFGSQILCKEAEEILRPPTAKIQKTRVQWLALDALRIPWRSGYRAEAHSVGLDGPEILHFHVSPCAAGALKTTALVRPRKQQHWHSKPVSLDSWSKTPLPLPGSPSEITPPSQEAKGEKAHWECRSHLFILRSSYSLRFFQMTITRLSALMKALDTQGKPKLHSPLTLPILFFKALICMSVKRKLQ